ncbi:MAG: hypothetical protein WC806_06800 [Candidatus Gracilibacteria bacterium]|jgi:hypothetical protein
MSESEPEIDPLRAEYEYARDKSVEGYSTAIQVRAAAEAALTFFELGLKLGREQDQTHEDLIEEIRGDLTKREQQIAEVLYPSRRKK